ncbi:hypothetical protein EGW08_013101 [Elysia chlorotica]|uniref:DUF3456 domain-containing protein n=1 Tax=Elysia chlorotica TaxID=188477 RepID=A0A3S1HGZ0_ELYCH|nr:hypothetical protein EGW08_013101 [Elysia chlorotica]
MGANKKICKVLAFGFLLSIVIITNLLVLCMAEEELDESILQQKIQEHGMDPGTSQVFKPPQMSDEEKGSRHMPKHLRCAGCVAVAHQFELEYKQALKSVKAKKRLSVVDQIDVADTVCQKKMIEYGLKEHQGKTLLAGPGLAAADIPGMMEGGGKWEARMSTLCMEIIEEFEEEGIYDIYTEKGAENFASGLCSFICKNKDEILDLKAPQTSEKDEL